MTFIDLRFLTWPEAAALREEPDVIGLIPTGALEQHGPHLPMIMDSVHADALGRAIAERLWVPVIVAPVVTPGLSDHHLAFPGTVTVRPETFHGIVEAYIAAFERLAIGRIAIFSGHGGNFTEIGRIAAAHTESESPTTVIAYDDLQRFIDLFMDAARRVGLDPPVTDVHAGLLETSIALTLFDADQVKPFEEVRGYTAADPGWLDSLMSCGIRELSESGVLGSPAGANAEAGAAMFDALVDELVSWIRGEFQVSTGPVADAQGVSS
jgi:creatinine amidohydrolase